jgi:hypothetical protein
MDSRYFGILTYENVNTLTRKKKTFKKSDVKQKLYVMKNGDGLLFVPVLHELNERNTK